MAFASVILIQDAVNFLIDQSGHYLAIALQHDSGTHEEQDFHQAHPQNAQLEYLMRLNHIIFASTLLVCMNASGDLQVLRTGIQMEEVQEHAGWNAGTVWKGLKDGSPQQMTYVRVTGASETLRESDGCTWTRPRGFYAPSTEWTNCTSRDGKATVELKWPVFPFHVGKTWAFNVDAGRWRTSRECKVVDTARVRIVSGEYDTFKIVCNDKWNTRTRYYAPKLGATVYYERHRRKKGQRTKYELIEIVLTE